MLDNFFSLCYNKGTIGGRNMIAPEITNVIARWNKECGVKQVGAKLCGYREENIDLKFIPTGQVF